MANVDTECVVAGLGTVVYCVDSSFDKASKAVLKESDGLISFRDLAYARIVDAEASGSWKNSSLCANGSYVKEGSLFVPKSNNRRIWLSDSLVLQEPALDVKIKRNGVQYVLKKFKVSEYLEQIGRDNYFVLFDTSKIPTDRFGEDARTVWAFKDQAKDYGLLLKDAGIKTMKIEMYNYNNIDSESRPFTYQLWFHGLDGGSYIGANSRIRNFGNDGVRGVRHKLIVKHEQNNIAAPKYYTINQVIADGVRESSFAPDQIKILENIMEQNNYKIIKDTK